MGCHILIAMVLLGSTSASTLAAAYDDRRDTKAPATNCPSEAIPKNAQPGEKEAQTEHLNDAIAFAREWFQGKMALCGDSSFREYRTEGERRSWNTLTEFKGFSFWIEPGVLTPGDILNGLAFKGRLHVDASAIRQYDSYHMQWIARSDPQPGSKCCIFSVILPITNQQGLWTVDIAQNPFWQASNKTTCNAATKIAAER